MKIIHVAGTNGKGSISRMLMNILKSAGYITGIFNSPFLKVRNEYLCVNGTDCSDNEYSFIAGIVKNAVERNIGKAELNRRPTEFEFSFAMAMEYFSRRGCDFAIVECGLGGKSDATNVFNEKELSIIANIGLDHTKLLGSTLKDISKQKCGIIINNDTVVAYPSEPEAMRVIRNICKKRNAKLITPDYLSFGSMKYYNPGFPEPDIKNNDPATEKIWLSMPGLIDGIALSGEYQKRNGMVAISAAAALRSKGYKKINLNTIREGLKNVKWPGRFETVNDKPLVIIDGSHNVQGVRALCESLDILNIKKAVFVIGVMADKDYLGIFDMLAPYIEYLYSTEPDNPRRLSADEITKEFIKRNVSSEAVSDPKQAVKCAVEYSKTFSNGDIPVIVTGSLYMTGKIRDVFTGKD